MTYVERSVRVDTGNSYPENFSMHRSYQPSFYEEDDALDQLENARLNRSGYYKRMDQSRGSPLFLNAPSSMDDNEVSGTTMVLKEKGISDGGLSESSLPRVPEPHPSWRFYTSYDNGEWKRHMVPVYHAEKDVLNTSPGIGTRSPISSFSFDSTTPTYALESNIRRMRLGRPSVYDCLQSRRQRLSSDHRRQQAPRSAETIMNSMEYLPKEEIKRRYNFDNYSPKRRTEYGERVIYPRVKSDSVSSGDSGFKKLSDNISEQDEVTRSVHPSCLQVDSTSSFETSTSEGRPPSMDNNHSGEKIIIPTKYKNGNYAPTKAAKSILDMADDPRNLMPHKERSLRRRTPSPAPRLNNISTNYITSEESSLSPAYTQQRRSRSRDATYSGLERSQEHDREIKVLLVNPSVNQKQHVTTINTGFNTASNNRNANQDVAGFKEIRPTARSNFRDVTQQQQHNQQQNQIQSYQHHQQPFQQQQPQSFQRSEHHVTQSNQNTALQQQATSGRATELAARVKANTMATVQQMQDRMLSDIKDSCPQVADTIDSLISGKAVDGSVIQSKQLTMEQTNVWQAGRPVEGKITREARVFTNDPISGPQDFVERSSICQDLSDIPNAPTFIQHPFLQLNKNAYMSSNSTPLESDDQNRHLSSVFFTPEPTYNEKNRGFFQASTSQNEQLSRSSQQQEYPLRESHNFPANYRSNQNDSFVYPLETSESSGFKEKIIIPTKYKERTHDSGNERSTASSRFASGYSRDEGEMSRNFQSVTSPVVSNDFDAPRTFQRQQQFRTVTEPSTKRQQITSSLQRRGHGDKKGSFEAAGGNVGSKEWSYEMALKEAV